MHITPIGLIDYARQERVDAFLVEDPDDEYVAATDNLWRIYRQRFADALAKSNKPIPSHDHWNWKWKLQQELTRDALFKCYGIIADNEPQGLMLLNYGREYLSRLPEQAGRLLVYLAYMESAPWNLREYCEQPRYGGIGTLLYKEAIQYSNRLGFGGHVALHSMPGAEEFYAIRCKMRSCGPDQNYGGLVYFESAPADSLAFLEEMEG